MLTIPKITGLRKSSILKGIGVMVKIHKLLPKSIKRQIYWTVSMPVKKYEEKNAIELEAMLPKISLEEKHMRNLKVLTDKATFLNVLPKGAIGAEIGVAQGNYTEKILEAIRGTQGICRKQI